MNIYSICTDGVESNNKRRSQNGTKKIKAVARYSCFIVIMVMFVVVARPIQAKLGLFGLAITELILPAMAVGFVGLAMLIGASVYLVAQGIGM